MSTAEYRFDFGEILDRTDLRRVLNEHTASNGRAGVGEKWHCPVPGHDDHNPSVSVTRTDRGRERWKCWSNPDHRGDAIDLIQAVNGGSKLDAAKYLADRAGIRPDAPLPAPIRRPAPPPRTTTLDAQVPRYVTACASVLRSRQGAPYRDWLTDRGLEPATVQANKIGVDVGRQMMRRAKGLPYGATAAITFPAFDAAGDITYVQARYLDIDTAGRKYDNPSAAMGPNPRVGFAIVPAGAPLRPDVLLVCEGLPDALIAAQAGFTAAAVFGSQAPDGFVAARLINAAANRPIVLAIDNDTAGDSGAATLTEHLVAAGAAVHAYALPDDLDLNDWALAVPDWADDVSASVEDLAAATVTADTAAPGPVDLGPLLEQSGSTSSAFVGEIVDLASRLDPANGAVGARSDSGAERGVVDLTSLLDPGT